MRDIVSKLFHKSVLVTLGSTLVIAGAITAGVITFTQPSKAAAASCPNSDAPETNIITDGLTVNSDGSCTTSTSDFVNNLKAYFDGSRKDPKQTDVPAALKAGGLTDSMFTSGNWQVGVSYDKDWNPHLSPNNSSIVVGSTVVATNLWITSRCPNIPVNCKEEPQGLYVKIPNTTDAYKRDANWFFDKHANGTPIHFNQVLVHFTNGVADFAIWTKCGNMVMIKPVIPSSLVCKDLDAVPGATTDTSIDYTFTVTATVQNTPNITYTINFGDGKSDQKSVTNGQATATFTHTYTRLDTDKTYTALAQVNGQPQVAACQKSFSIPALKKLVFACQALTAHVDSSSNGSITYTFTGNVTGTDTVKNYQFFFGDNSQTDVQTSNTATHTYTFDTSNVHTFTAHFVATSTTGLTTDQNDKNCQYSFSTRLTETGPGSIAGIMAGTSALGVGIHQFLLRRKLNA